MAARLGVIAAAEYLRYRTLRPDPAAPATELEKREKEEPRKET